MYVMTNRVVKKGKGLKVFGDKPNNKGPNELRLVKVEKTSRGWQVEAIEDKLSLSEAAALKKQYALDIDATKQQYASLKAACAIFAEAVEQGKSLLFFTHGYNNDMEDILKTARQLEDLYGVIVVAFSWPANGGGALTGTASYLRDKSDARASVDAFNRFVKKIKSLHASLVESVKAELWLKAEKRHRDNPEAAALLFSQLMEKQCGLKLSLLCHSMGNYLLKRALSTSETCLDELVFDNICLVAADTNAPKHEHWLEKLDANNRIYVVINENDYALKASRLKPGKEQKARLGHSVSGLDAKNAVYIDVTDARHVNNGHSYFKGDAVEGNDTLRGLFDDMFNGRSVENNAQLKRGNKVFTLS